MAASKFQALWNHPAGPKTNRFISVWNQYLVLGEPKEFFDPALWSGETRKDVHFWAPTFKWGISIANLADSSKPPEKVSYPQQIAVTATGLIWSRYSTVITPKNWNLFSVNVVMAGTGIYQLSRKIMHLNKEQAAVAKE